MYHPKLTWQKAVLNMLSFKYQPVLIILCGNGLEASNRLCKDNAKILGCEKYGKYHPPPFLVNLPFCFLKWAIQLLGCNRLHY